MQGPVLGDHLGALLARREVFLEPGDLSGRDPGSGVGVEYRWMRRADQWQVSI